MCKMLFVGVQTELPEILFDKDHPDFYMEKIAGEFLLVRQVFHNPFVYFVGTSDGCSCCFGIKLNQWNPQLWEHVSPIQKVLNRFRKICGTYEKWMKKHQGNTECRLRKQAHQLRQTFTLIDNIEHEIVKGNFVELYCTWAGDYAAQPETYLVIDTKHKKLRNDFEITEKEFVTFL